MSKNSFSVDAYFNNFLMILRRRDASAKLATIEDTRVRRPAQGHVAGNDGEKGVCQMTFQFQVRSNNSIFNF